MSIKIQRYTLLFLFVFLSLSLPGRSQSFNVSQRGSVQRVSEHRTRVKDDDKATHDGAYWFGRGYELHQGNHYQEAIEAFVHSIELGHRQPTAMYNIACGFSLLNDKENALTWLERSLAIGFDRTDLLRNDSDLDPLRTDPRFQQLLRNPAVISKAAFTTNEEKPAKDKEGKHKEDKATDRYQEAISRFEELRRDGSTDGQQWYKIGSRLLQLRDFDRAIAALTTAVDHLGYYPGSAMYNLACTYALKGEPEAAIKWLERAVNSGFDDPDKFQNDSDIASLHADPRFETVAKLARTLSLSQFNQDSFDGSNYSKQRWAPAVELYEKFLSREPNNGRAWFNLGYALHYSREHAKAITAFERAIQLSYRNPTAMYNIACGYAMMNQREAAFDWLDKSIAAGFDIKGYLRGDEDLDNLRNDARFKRLAGMFDDQDKHKDKHDK
jgi:Flp pilus assembly protein TadD